MSRLTAFTFIVVRGVEESAVTFYASCERVARSYAVKWAKEHGWAVVEGSA